MPSKEEWFDRFWSGFLALTESRIDKPSEVRPCARVSFADWEIWFNCRSDKEPAIVNDGHEIPHAHILVTRRDGLPVGTGNPITLTFMNWGDRWGLELITEAIEQELETRNDIHD